MIFFFSGNGNSEFAANALGCRLDEETIRIDASTPLSFDASGWRRVVWVFPVYSWGIPLPVSRFISEVTLTNLPESATHHMAATCGDDAGLTHIAWRKVIASRGWRAKGTYTIQMPNTYVTFPGFDVDSESVARHKLSVFPERADAVARAIRHDARVDDVVRGSFARLKSRLVYPFFMRFLTSAKPFSVSEACVSCRKCETGCPVSNISMDKDGHPVWGNHCAMCLRCYHRCPVEAINYGRLTIGKGHYSGPEAMIDHLPEQ